MKVIPTNSGDSVERVLDPFDSVEAMAVLKTGRVGRSWGPKLGFMASTFLFRNCRIQRRGRPPPRARQRLVHCWRCCYHVTWVKCRCFGKPDGATHISILMSPLGIHNSSLTSLCGLKSQPSKVVTTGCSAAKPSDTAK